MIRSGKWRSSCPAIWQRAHLQACQLRIGKRDELTVVAPGSLGRVPVNRRVTFVMVADMPAEGANAFRDYEDQVLPLLSRHQGTLERRLRSLEGTTEVHVVNFESRASYDSYLRDPERQAHRQLLDGAAVEQRLLEVADVDVP